MITALVSGLFGLFNAFLPDLIGFFKKKQEMIERREDRAHELAMMDKTAEVQVKLGALKIEEVKVGGMMEAMRAELTAWGDQMKAIYAAQTPIGVRWVDAWNAALRPATVSLIIAVFTLGIGLYEVSVVAMWWRGTLDPVEVMDLMFKGLVGEAIQAVLGYLFGYRGGMRAREALSK